MNLQERLMIDLPDIDIDFADRTSVLNHINGTPARLENNKKLKRDKLNSLMSGGDAELPKYLVYFFKDMFKRFENLVTETVEYRKMPLISDIINKKKGLKD